MSTRKRCGLIALSMAFATLLMTAGAVNAETVKHFYDNLNRLVRTEYVNGPKIVYKYDEVGNRTQMFEDNIAPVTTASPPGGLYNAAEVTLTCDDGSPSVGCYKIYYSIDGTTPTIVYTEPITISSTKTLKFYATDLAGNKEAVKSQTYTIDTTPPSGTVRINNGATATADVDVTLNLSCSITGDCYRMRFKKNDGTWSSAEAFAATKAWTLASGDGSKTVTAQFRDKAGNWSADCKDTISLDTTPPVGTILIDNGDYLAGSSEVTLYLGCGDHINGAVTPCSRMAFSDDNITYTSSEPFNSTKPYTLPEGIGFKTVWVRYYDAVGNQSVGEIKDIILVTRP